MRPVFNSFVLTLILTNIAVSQPKLIIDKIEIDMGHMYPGEKKAGKITLKNIGDDTLRILHVETSCGCTAVNSPKGFLLPGQFEGVDFEFSPSETHGTVERFVYIYTNDPISQYIAVRIIADMKEVFRWILGSDSIYVVENAVNPKPVTRRIAMKNVSGSPIVILGDSVSSPSISVKMDKKSLRPNDTLNLDVTVLPERLGLSNETLYVLTDNDIEPRVEVRITVLGTRGN